MVWLRVQSSTSSVPDVLLLPKVYIYNYNCHLFKVHRGAQYIFLKQKILDRELARTLAEQKGDVVDETAVFDSNCITPGTAFMQVHIKNLDGSTR